MKRTSLAILGLCALVLSPVVMTRPAEAQVNCTGVAAWSANSVNYAVGALVTYEGSEYKCLQQNTSETGWDPVDVPALWTLVGTCGTSTTGATCSAAPSAPTGLSASDTTSTGTTLSWSTVTPPSNCTISSYTIYKSGASIGTSTGTSFAVSGLSASTTYTFTVAATDSDGTGAQSSSVSVTTSSGGSTEGPYGGSAAAIPGTVQAENYDTGGQGVGYSVTSTNGSDNGYRSDGVDLEACTDTGGGVDLGWTAAGQWFRYTVNVATAGTYTATFRVANGATASGSFHIQNSAGTNLSGAVNVAVTGGWQTWASVTASVTLPAGQQVLTVYQDTANFNINYISFAAQSSGEGPYGGSAAAIPGTVQAENYDTGGQGIGYSVTSTNGSDNGYRSDGVDLEACTDTGGGVDLGWTAAGQWFRYTVNVATAGTYTATFRVANGATASGSFHIQNSSGTNLSGAINVAVTGGWQTWTSVTANVTLPAGQQVLTVYQDTANFNINYIAFTSGSTSCTTKPSAPAGLAASGTTSSSTTLNWNTVGAPSNCSISGYTVYQGGTAIATVSSGTSYTVTNLAASTTYSFTVAANDAAGTGSQSSSVSVTTQPNTSTGKGKMIGYWETWASLSLLTAATDYDIIELAFATASGTDGQTQSMPATTESTSQIQSDIATLHGQGKKVLISVGGASTFTIKLESASDESAFVSSVESIVNSFNLDGLDLDIENNNLALNPGDTDINNPTTPSTIYMIQAIQALKSNYGSNFMITMAPQVADINCAGHPLGNDGAGLYWGSFIPLINKARANITYVMTQDYNASQMYEKNGTSVVNQATPDFDVAMSDLLLSGYNIFGTGQAFPALNANQVVVGTPAVTAAAGSGYNTPAAVDQAIDYIKFGTSYGGSYTLSATYPSLGGVMTWDCDYDYNAGDPMAGALMADVHR